MDVAVEPGSYQLHQLQALERRLRLSHPNKEQIARQLKKEIAGIKGEKALDFPLDFLTEKDHVILNNSRLIDEKAFFEIDRLLICPRYMLILEAKNWYGSLYFDGEQQVIRVGDDGREEGLPNPILQAKLQRHRLQKWLQSQDISSVPIFYLIVISFPSTIIKPLYPEHPIPKEVTNSKQLLFKIMELDDAYPESTISHVKIEQISNAITTAHTPKDVNILKRFEINRDDLRKGVICPNCTNAPMMRKHYKWHCNKCGYMTKDAHLAALHDYKLLIGDKITNRQTRDFLQLESPQVTKRLLQIGNFPVTGQNKTREYELKFESR